MKKQPEYESFSNLWEALARHLGLSGERRQPDNVRPLGGKRKRRRLWLWLTAAILALLMMTFFGRGVGLYTDWLWFGEVGFTNVFWKTLITKSWLAVATGAVFFAIVYTNILLARRMAPKYHQLGEGTEIIERAQIPDHLMRWLIPLLLLFPTLIAMAAGGAAWDDFLLFRNGVLFGIADPVFNRDVSFYVFTLPFLRILQSFAWWTLIFTFFATTAIHLFDYAIDWKGGRLNFAPRARGHLSVIMGSIMFVLGLGYLLKSYALVYSPRGVVVGASYTDVHAQLPVLRFLVAIAVLAGILFLVNIHFKGWKLPAAAIGLIIATAIIGGRVYPFLVQQYQVSPNEIAREEPYIKYNIDFTREAYDLNDIQEEPFTAEENLTAADLWANSDTISNIRLWDPETLAQTYSQIQVIRPYYTFVDVDVDRYKLGGRLQQVMLSPRELATDQLESRTWQNQHLIFTHGYGLVMSPVAEVSEAGLPQLLIKDFPPQSSSPELKVEQPAIYFGDLANEYAVVDSGTEEFDYPKGDENVFTNYDGSGGVSLASWLHRLAFSWRFGSMKMLVSDSINEDTKILIYREIDERLGKIAPFLRYDRDPYIALVDGRLYWIQDAYTTTDNYPYSQPSKAGYNYIRNSVKIVVDAYNGDVTMYAVDGEDPILQTYSRIFPGLFTPADQVPEGIRDHFRYPEDLFRVQAEMYTTYHMTNPQVFYNKEDQWSVPRVQSGGKTALMDPYYVIMGLPGEEDEQFMLMLPFTPSTKDNMISWMAAKSDPENYGQRIVFKFPKEKLVFGPMQIQARINQDPEISRQLSLWAQRGSQVIHGNLLVIPVDQSILYVEPLYLQAEQGQIPELKRVTVAYGSRIAMDEDLASALEGIFAAPVSGVPAAPPAEGEAPDGGGVAAESSGKSLQELAAIAQDHYNRAIEAQKRGDWSSYGAELDQLSNILEQMQAQSGQ
ncbi:MAG TPA: UPF0182 family protein [Actinobacteria bacterium]|nr:UPF0182 family protein [Actinomycetota bacterium]